MNTKILKKWAAALRSKKYNRKDREYLQALDVEVRDVSSYSALGVLIELFEQDLYEKKVKNRLKLLKIELQDGGVFSFNGQMEIPPKCVLKWAGISNEEAVHLARMNDDGKRSFKQIANHIEKHSDTKISKKWVTTLRAKEYRKGDKYLNALDVEVQEISSYSALGVLTELYQQDEKNKGKLLKIKRQYGRPCLFNGKDNFPPKCVLKWAGISNKEATYLTEMNSYEDEDERSFRQIANHIEKHSDDLGLSDD